MADSDLTFAKGYAQRVAARQQAAQAAEAAKLAASEPSAESAPVRSAAVMRKTVTPARTAAVPTVRRPSVARIDAPVDQPDRLDFETHALAFGEQRPHGFTQPQGSPFSFFGNLF
jgi:hypothetical protein